MRVYSVVNKLAIRQRKRLSEVLEARATRVCFVVVRAAVKPPYMKKARFLLRICAHCLVAITNIY